MPGNTWEVPAGEMRCHRVTSRMRLRWWECSRSISLVQSRGLELFPQRVAMVGRQAGGQPVLVGESCEVAAEGVVR
nr:hypothetical protein CFP56_60231 [Quercus suber]